MAKLTKMQTQAVINKLGREATELQNRLREDAEKNYSLSDNGKELRKLFEERDLTDQRAKEADDRARKFAESLGITGIYTCTKTETVLEKLKTLEINKNIPKINLDAALDDLIIESVDEDFNVDRFIEHYLNQMRNG